MTPECCVNHLVELVPDLRPILQEHIRDNDQLLPHVFLGDVTRYVVDQAGRSDPDALARVAQILDYFEACMGSGDNEVQNLIAVSFIENLIGEDVLESLRLKMGPNLRKELAAWDE